MEMTGAGSMVNTLASLSPLTHLSLVIRSFVRSFLQMQQMLATAMGLGPK